MWPPSWGLLTSAPAGSEGPGSPQGQKWLLPKGLRPHHPSWAGWGMVSPWRSLPSGLQIWALGLVQTQRAGRVPALSSGIREGEPWPLPCFSSSFGALLRMGHTPRRRGCPLSPRSHWLHQSHWRAQEVTPPPTGPGVLLFPLHHWEHQVGGNRVSLCPGNNLCPQFFSIWMPSNLVHSHQSNHLRLWFLFSHCSRVS